MKTFVFTDLAGSTALKSRMSGRNDNERARSFVDKILKPHLERLEAQLSECHGQRVKNLGDGHLFVFDDVTQAARWAITVQQKHHDEISSFRIDVKIGIHVGNPVPHPEDPNDFIGKPLDYAARLTDHATGGQILVSRQVMTLIVGENVDDVRFHDHGERYLAGIGDRLVFELLYGEKTPQDTKSKVAPPEAEKDNFPTDDLAGFLKAAGSVDQEIPTSSQAAGGSDVKLAAADALAGSSLSLIGQRLGQYELLEMLGSGGMGDVYLAKHVGMERQCAIKVIKKDLLQTGHAELVDRFYREIKAAGDLKHPNIVVAYDSSTPHDDIHYLVMEYVEGISLDKLIQRTGPLRVENACELIRQAAAGLQSLHDRKMVHRDIKPSNLILAMDGSRAVVKILDLGLALLVDETEDRLTEFQDKPIGTGMFMAPEQWENTSVDIRADIYSLGCTMYHLLVGHPPFKHSHLKQKHAHQTERVPRIRRDTPIPKQVWAVQQKMLAKRPEERFATPQEVADALTDLGDGSDLERLFQVSVRSSVTIDAPDVHRHDTYSAGHSDWETETARNTTRLGTPPPPETGWRGALEWATRPWAAATVLLALLAAFIGVPLAYQLFADRPPGSQLSPAVRQEAINFLTTLPGLNGRWWYYEIPWYCPRARLVLLSSLTDSDYEKLKRLAAAANESGFYTELKRLTDAAIADESIIKPAFETEAAAAQFRDIYRLLVQLQPDPLKRSKTDDADAESGTMRERELVKRATTLAGLTNHPADQHLLAILQWRRMEAVAKDTFERAQTGYDALPKNVAPNLVARCRVDHATTLILSRRTYEVAADYCRRARGRLGDPGANYFRLYALTTEAEAYQKQSTPETLADMEATLQEAANLAIASLNAQHPLRAFLHERTSVMRLETWQLYAAGSEAIQAEGIRNARLKTSSRDRFAKHARYQMLRDKQIAALAHHFKGAVDSALQTYQELLTQVVEDGNNPQLESAERSVLMAMQPNLYGRKSDCYFYQAADFAAALADIDQAKQSALEVGFPNDDRIVHLVRICYRASMTASLTGNAQAAEAYRDEAKRYDAKMASMFQTKVAAQRRRNALFQQVADALLLADGDRTKKLVQVVENNVVDFAKLTRDDRQLLLFVCQFVIEHGQLEPELRDRIDNRMDYLLAPMEAANQTYADEYSSHLTKSVRAWSAQGAAIGQPRLEAANLLITTCCHNP